MVAACFAADFGTVRGLVHDPQHRPVADARVTLSAHNSEFSKSIRTDSAGEFQFDAVPLGEYVLSVSDSTFVSEQQLVTVFSGSAPILHFELHLPSQNQTVTVLAEGAQAETPTPATLIDRLQIQETPGASRTNSLSMITNYVPGSYLTHDQLHIRGGHQVSWLIDGVPIPNTNIASNLGPQIDPKDIDDLEIQRGSYSADYGDRTYGVFNVLPRTGFERHKEAELILGLGNFFQSDDQINFGGHSKRFAYYASLNGNRTQLGLQTPTSAVIHDAANGFGGFTSLIYNANPQNQFRLVAQSRRDFYQVPFDSGDPGTASAKQFLHDANNEADNFVLFSWVRTLTPGAILTVSPFFHGNSANYQSSLTDYPSSTSEDRSSNYFGGQATLSWVRKRSNFRAGLFGFTQQDRQTFGLICHDPTQTDCQGERLTETDHPSGEQFTVYAQEQFKAASWLTLNAGLRQTHFDGGTIQTLAGATSTVEDTTSPRFGASVRIPKINLVFRAFYGHFYQAPPLLTVSGPLLQAATSQNLGFTPLHGERDEEHQFGVTIPVWSWTIDADNFLTRAKNFFDHNNFNNSDLFFPVSIKGARISGWELAFRSPQIRKRGQFYLNYSNQLALGCGGISGGLTDFSFGGDCGILDHDQRDTLHLGGQLAFPWHAYAAFDVGYASGFANGNSAIQGDHLLPHATFDLTLGKSFGEKFSASLQALNVANRRVLLDNSLTFGGTHYLNPREIFVQLRFRVHY
jgi:outer membrane cobalamin receptor